MSQRDSTGDFIQILQGVIDKTKRELKVATLGIVRKVDEDNLLAIIEPFPIAEGTESKYISCRYFNTAPTENEIVLAIFTDKDFSSNLRTIGNDGKIRTISSKSELHSEQYGILINLK